MALVIHVVPGSVTTGLWCPECLLPSGYEQHAYTLREDGPHRLLTVRKCHDCGAAL